MEKKLFILGLILLFQFHLEFFAQGEADKWYFSGRGAVDFSLGVPVALNDYSTSVLSFEQSASIADAAGNLLFYADGTATVLNRDHVAMPNGTNVFMQNSVTQGICFVPKPGDDNIYYLIHIGTPAAIGTLSLYYSEIDIRLDNGRGDIVSSAKNVVFPDNFENCAEKLAVTQHCNGVDYWLLVHDLRGTAYKAYLVSNAGISLTPVVSDAGASFEDSPGAGSVADAVGQMKFSPDRTRIATVLGGQGTLELLNFNNCTGSVCHQLNLGEIVPPGGTTSYGTEFSPDNTKVYASGSENNANGDGTLKQWDISLSSDAAIINSVVEINDQAGYSLQLAPDSNIYYRRQRVAGQPPMLGVINDPNVAGMGANYDPDGIELISSTSIGNGLGLPNFISSYFGPPSTFVPPSPVSSQVDVSNCLDNGSATVTFVNTDSTMRTYNWSEGSSFGPTYDTLSTIYDLAVGEYNVIIEDLLACWSDTVLFEIEGFRPWFISIDTSICSDQSFTLPNGNVADIGGVYIDSLQTVGGCDSIITTTLTIDSLPSLFEEDTIMIELGESVDLGTIVEDGVYEWSPSNGLSCTTCSTTVATPTETIIYNLTVVDTNGCIKSEDVTVEVSTGFGMYVPTAFTPEGDNLNDVLFSVNSGIKRDDGSYRFVIFNRWGEKLFETNDLSIGWDGFYKGKKVQQGTYIWKVEFTDLRNNKHVKSGKVVLLRNN